MNLATAIYARLRADTTLNGLVKDRIYPNVARQDKIKPYLVYYLEYAPEHELTGKSTNLMTADLTVECYTEGETAYADVQAVADAVRESLDGYRGTLDAEQGASTIAIRTCILLSTADSFSPPVDGGEKGTHVVVQSYSLGFHYTPPTPV